MSDHAASKTRLDGLDELASLGQDLLRGGDPEEAHDCFTRWIEAGSDWLSKRFPNSGLAAEWGAQSSSNLVMGQTYQDDPVAWHLYRNAVQTRLQWLSRLPDKLERMDAVRRAQPHVAQEESQRAGRKEIKLQTVSRAYVDPSRIAELSALSQTKFDLSKLIRLCEELNICFAGECYLAMIMETRAIIDHVPPIFGFSKFSEVANNYPGSKSFKDIATTLETSSRKIADQYLHGQIRGSESLPNVTQVDFSNALDVLLGEIVRILR